MLLICQFSVCRGIEILYDELNQRERVSTDLSMVRCTTFPSELKLCIYCCSTSASKKPIATRGPMYPNLVSFETIKCSPAL